MVFKNNSVATAREYCAGQRGLINRLKGYKFNVLAAIACLSGKSVIYNVGLNSGIHIRQFPVHGKLYISRCYLDGDGQPFELAVWPVDDDNNILHHGNVINPGFERFRRPEGYIYPHVKNKEKQIAEDI